MGKIPYVDVEDCKTMTHVVAPSAKEHIEEYLEVLWLSEDDGESLAKISSIAKKLAVSNPSVVEMLKKLAKQGYVRYEERQGVSLTPKGRRVGKQIVRNHRLLELLFAKSVGGHLDEEIACGMEHHLTEKFANNICTSLDHPRKCPHDYEIPKGRCCK